MIGRARLAFLALVLVAAAPAAHADPSTYSAKEIRGQVVDDLTGEPLANVIVVARWVLVRETIPFFLHQDYNDPLKVEETVTGADGRYVIPAWGPVMRPFLRHLESQDPTLYFFRGGYYPWSVTNEVRSHYNRDALRLSEWDGRKVPLRRFTGQPQEYIFPDGRFRQEVKVSGTLEDYAMRINGLQVSLNWAEDSEALKSYPRMASALEDERARLEKAGVHPNYQIRSRSFQNPR